MYQILKQHLPEEIPVYADMKEDMLDIKRADQDILIDGKSLSEI
jgi:hypothetical protein